jgi:hypothetical protein
MSDVEARQRSKPWSRCLEVPKDALHDREMGLMRVVHVEAHLLDHVVNVGLGEGEVLKSPS